MLVIEQNVILPSTEVSAASLEEFRSFIRVSSYPSLALNKSVYSLLLLILVNSLLGMLKPSHYFVQIYEDPSPLQGIVLDSRVRSNIRCILITCSQRNLSYMETYELRGTVATYRISPIGNQH